MGEEVEATQLSAEELDTCRNCETIDGDEEFLMTILEMLCTSIDDFLPKIDEALKEENVDEIWKMAHSLKGSSLQCALNNLGNAAKEVEHHFKTLSSEETEDSPEKRRKLVDKLNLEGSKVRNTYKALLANQ